MMIGSLNQAHALAVASNGDLYYSADHSLHVVKKDEAAGTLVAGGFSQPGSTDGSLTTARFQNLEVNKNINLYSKIELTATIYLQKNIGYARTLEAA